MLVIANAISKPGQIPDRPASGADARVVVEVSSGRAAAGVLAVCSMMSSVMSLAIEAVEGNFGMVQHGSRNGAKSAENFRGEYPRLDAFARSS
jgi:hypothetical protein